MTRSNCYMQHEIVKIFKINPKKNVIIKSIENITSVQILQYTQLNIKSLLMAQQTALKIIVRGK